MLTYRAILIQPYKTFHIVENNTTERYQIIIKKILNICSLGGKKMNEPFSYKISITKVM